MTNKNPKRPYDHASKARKGSARLPYLMNWIRVVQSEGREPVVLVLEEFSQGASSGLVGFVEQCYIKSLRAIGHRLCNVTDGGEDGESGVASPLLRAYLSVVHKQHNVDHPETNERRAETMRRHYDDPKNRERQRNSHLGLSPSDETRVKLSNAQIGNTKGVGRVVTEAERERHRLNALGNTFALGSVQSEESCEKKRASLKKHYEEHPETRVRQSEMRRAWWAAKKAAKNGD